ncbi:polyprenyl synthetase family protein [bacterium]|nr:polyprenyl synthetase family protein [bacterium]
MEKLSFADYYQKKKAYFESHLAASFPRVPNPVAILEESMRYSLLAGGKRLRPLLLLTTIECTGKNADFAMPLACAIEYIHTYSLIHDDLPCMDDDELRRGQPTNHIKFGEDIALLAGDALLTHCFALMSTTALLEHTSAGNILKAIHILAESAGVFGMVSGQVADIQRQYVQQSSEEALSFIHAHKTGALITAAVQIGSLLAEVTERDFSELSGFGAEIGKCFQIQDDILDVTGVKERLGKSPGTDQKNETLTYPLVFGLEKSKQLASQCYENALRHLDNTGINTIRLQELANFVLKRDH